MQFMTKDTVKAFVGLEKFLQKNFCPCLFFGKPKTLPPTIGALSTLLENKSGLGLQNPVTSANEKYNSLLRTSCKMSSSVKGERYFSTNDYIWSVKGWRRESKKD